MESEFDPFCLITLVKSRRAPWWNHVIPIQVSRMLNWKLVQDGRTKTAGIWKYEKDLGLFCLFKLSERQDYIFESFVLANYPALLRVKHVGLDWAIWVLTGKNIKQIKNQPSSYQDLEPAVFKFPDLKQTIIQLISWDYAWIMCQF